MEADKCSKLVLSRIIVAFNFFNLWCFSLLYQYYLVSKQIKPILLSILFCTKEVLNFPLKNLKFSYSPIAKEIYLFLVRIFSLHAKFKKE